VTGVRDYDLAPGTWNLAPPWRHNGFITKWLYGVSPLDPASLAGAAVLLATAVFLASWIPARRAARIEPMGALRYE
jgi:ABC-type lipoprotein release transport system permease subunit